MTCPKGRDGGWLQTESGTRRSYIRTTSRLARPSPRSTMSQVCFVNAQDTLRVPAGGVVFREGDKGEEMFGIIEGQIELYATARLIAVLGADDVFGEMALVDSSPGWQRLSPAQTASWQCSTSTVSSSWFTRRRRSHCQ